MSTHAVEFMTCDACGVSAQRAAERPAAPWPKGWTLLSLATNGHTPAADLCPACGLRTLEALSTVAPAYVATLQGKGKP